MRARKSHIRRFVAAAALFAVGFGMFESALGLVSDSLAFYEESGDASGHLVSHHDDDGHEHAFEDLSDTHAPEHGHWTSPCHCAHVHGPAITTVTADIAPDIESNEVDRLDPRIHDQTCPDPLFHPPKT